MRSLRPLLLALPLLAACGSDFVPSGKKQVLFLNHPKSTLAEGLQWTLELPANVVAAEGSGLGMRKVYDYDFTGTQLEASGPGLTLVDATLKTEGWKAHVRCDQVQAAGTAELTVRVKTATGVRYEDALDVPCLKAAHMRYTLPAAREVVGNKVTVPYELSAAGANGAEIPLDGEGWSASDTTPFIAFAPRSAESTFVVETLAPGSNPIAVASSFQAPLLGLEVVPDDAWDLVFDAKHSSDRNTPLWSYTVKAVAKDGQPLGALASCQFAVTDGGKQLSVTQACDGTFDATSAIHVCAVFRDKKDCKDLTP